MLWVALGCAAVDAHCADYVRGDFRFSTGPAPAFVQERPPIGAWDPSAPGARDPSWRTWRYDRQVDHRDGGTTVYVDSIYEPRNTSSLAEAGRYSLQFNPEYQTLTIHRVELRRDGRWQNRLQPAKVSLARRETGFENDMADGEVTALVVLDDVRVNDVVRVSYTVSGANPVLAGQVSDEARLGWSNPMLDAWLRVLYPPGTPVRFNAQHTRLVPGITKDADATVFAVHSHAQDAVVNEGDYPAWYQPYPMIQVAPDKRWSDVVEWALPLYPSTSELPADLEARIAKWRQLPDAGARLAVALHAIQDEVRYFGVETGENTHRPSPPSMVWGRRYGDCKDKAYLLATVLGQLGIQAVPALVATDLGRSIAGYVPSAAVFDHVIVRARLGSSTVWVDPTISQQGGDPATHDLSSYGSVLPVAPGTAALEAIEPVAHPATAVAVVERFTTNDADGGLDLDVETEYRGASATSARGSLLDSRSGDLGRKYADYYGKRYGDVQIVSDPEVHDDATTNVLKVVEHYRLKAPWQSDSASTRWLGFSAEALNAATTLPAVTTRKGPLYFARRGHYSHRIVIRPPAGWKPQFGAGQAKVSTPAFKFRRDITVDHGTASVAFDLDVLDNEISIPGMGEHIARLREVRDDMFGQLGFDIPRAAGLESRDARMKALLKNVMDGGK